MWPHKNKRQAQLFGEPVLRPFEVAAILNFDVFEKNLKSAIFGPKISVTPLDICFLGQGIHFWCYFFTLTRITRKRGPNIHFGGQNYQNLDFLGK